MRQLTSSLFALLVFVTLGTAPAQAPVPAQEYLDRALRLANAYNWAEAGPNFVEAERLFIAQGDQKSAYQARLGKMRSMIQHAALPEVIVQMAEDLETLPFLQTDRRVRMFCLIVKGDFDGESDHAAMSRDWGDVQNLAKELGDKNWEHRADAQLGVAAFYNGDIESSRKRVGAALIAAHAIGDKPGEMMALAILAHGLTLMKLHSQALPYIEQALKVAKSDPDIGFAQVAHETKLSILIGTQKLEAAQQLADEILAYARRRQGTAIEASVLVELAQIALLRKDGDGAIRFLNAAVKIAKTGGYLDTLAGAQRVLTDIYLGQKNLAKAEESAAETAEAVQSRGDFITLVDRLNTLARLELAQGKYSDAERTYSRADTFVDAMVGRSTGVLDKVSLITAASDLYRDHFALVAEHFHDARKAFGIVEQVRGRVTADLLAAGSFTAPGAEQASKRAARIRLKLMAARSNGEVRRIREQLFVLEQARWVTPDVSILKANSGTLTDLQTVQRDLPTSTAILEYVVAQPRSYCLVITRTSARIVPLASGAVIERGVLEYLKAVKAKQAGSMQANTLYNSLLRPVREIAQHDRLVIVRDGQLYLLPFDGLVDGAGRYVAETKVVSYTPSSSTFHLLRAQTGAKLNARALLGVGAIPYDPGNVRRLNASRGYDLKSLANLPESKNELLAAAKAVAPGAQTLLVGMAATESGFKKQLLSRYSVLHLAVHGIANTEDPDRAALVMLSDPAAGEDGFLQASEVVQLKLNADLAVLSACDTAIGPIGGEEGIATLSRAFLLAGARSVVSTLWSIEDLSSLVLMRQFYAHLADNMAADLALTEAKRHVIRKFGRKAPPYYWAAFTLEGAGDRTVLRHSGRS